MEAGRLILLHTMDPRGSKLGGIETHVRLVLARHPEALALLFVGIDERGDLALGRIVRLAYEGRQIDFLPVAHVPASRINTAARSIGQSTTLRFMLGLIRYLPALRRGMHGARVSGEIERFEFAIVPWLIRLPFVLLVHNEGTQEDKMDSLLKRYWFLHHLNERIALTLASSIFAVNAAIAKRIEALSPALARKTAIMSVSIDTKRFLPVPFVHQDDAFHVCFAGRLDDFKDPPLMFETLALLDHRLRLDPAGRFRRVVFNYVGASDPARIPEFASIMGLTVAHGIQPAAEVARIMAQAHAGIITSFFEGMPCYLLEMIASGRPVGAIALPQFTAVIVPDRSGMLVSRGATPTASAESLADAFVEIAGAIDAERLSPASIAELVDPFSVEKQMKRLFACHEAVARSV